MAVGRVEGYAIVFEDGMLADAARVMPPSLMFAWLAWTACANRARSLVVPLLVERSRRPSASSLVPVMASSRWPNWLALAAVRCSG
jgi:hypothetical protein